MPTPRYRGRVKFFEARKNFGVITDIDPPLPILTTTTTTPQRDVMFFANDRDGTHQAWTAGNPYPTLAPNTAIHFNTAPHERDPAKVVATDVVTNTTTTTTSEMDTTDDRAQFTQWYTEAKTALANLCRETPQHSDVQSDADTLLHGPAMRHAQLRAAEGHLEYSKDVLYPYYIAPLLCELQKFPQNFCPIYPASCRWVARLLSERDGDGSATTTTTTTAATGRRVLYFSAKQRTALESAAAFMNTHHQIITESGEEEDTLNTLPLSDRLEEVLKQRTDRVIVVLEGVRDPSNVASICRTCDAFGVQHLWRVLPAFMSTAVKHNTLSRGVSRGTEAYLTQRVFSTASECVAALHESGATVWATDLADGAVGLTPSLVADEVDMKGTNHIDGEEGKKNTVLAIVMGEESYGISQDLRDAADRLVILPMHGVVQSLNVAVATALALQTVFEGLKGTLVRGIVDVEERSRVRRKWALLEARTSVPDAEGAEG